MSGQQIVGYVPAYTSGAAIPYYTSGLEQIVGAGPVMQHHPMMAVHAPQFVGPNAAPAAIVPPQPAHASPLGRLPYGGSPSVEDQKPRNVRQYPLGFVQLAIPAGQTATVTSRPQVLFRGYRLIVPTSGGSGPAPASPAVNFVIIDLRVGKNSQLVQATELPASIFQEQSFDIALTMDTAQISQDIAITVRNTDAVNARDFRAVLIGAALE